MSRPTRFRTLGNEELLRECGERREHSDIIEELCQRIEGGKLECGGIDIGCPVCEADLTISIDRDGDVSEVRTKSI